MRRIRRSISSQKSAFLWITQPLLIVGIKTEPSIHLLIPLACCFDDQRWGEDCLVSIRSSIVSVFFADTMRSAASNTIVTMTCHHFSEYFSRLRDNCFVVAYIMPHAALHTYACQRLLLLCSGIVELDHNPLRWVHLAEAYP